MGIFRTKSEMGSNERYYSNLFEEGEAHMNNCLGKLFAENFCIGELDPMQVELWNATIAFWNKTKELSLEWAREQDKEKKELNEQLETLRKTQEEMLALIKRQKKAE